MKKSAYTYFFIFITLIPLSYFGLYSLFVNLHQTQVYNQIKENSILSTDTIQIPKSELYINTKHITWKNNNKEISFNHHLLDVVNVISNDSCIKIVCVFDSEETNMINQFIEFFYEDDTETEKSKSTKKLKDFLSITSILNTFDSAFFITIKNNSDFALQNFSPEKGYLSAKHLPPIYS